MEEHDMYDIGTALAELKRGQLDHAQQISALSHRLFGNGSPGALSKMEDRVEGLEAKANKTAGALAAFTLAWSFLLGLLEFLTRGGHIK
jgi:hypothetical protein